MSILQIENLTLAYNGKSVIDDLSLTVREGRITALVGANGSGKSTLLRGISRLLRPKQGSVYLDGKAIHRLSTRKVAQRLGILPQGPSAPEGITVRELVEQGRFPHLSFFQQRSEEDERIISQALRITRMESFTDRPLDTLSGGQRQRAWIAMALAQDTDIMLLDEPTTFLDLAHQIEILDLLQELNSRGRTVVMVLHDLNQACRYADMLVAIKDGDIYNAGRPEEIMSTRLVADVFDITCQLIDDPVAQTPMCIPLSRSEDRQDGGGVQSARLR